MVLHDNLALANKWALVTGATGGIGREITRCLADAGANLVLHTFSKLGDAQALADEITREGRSARVVRCDLSDPSARQELIRNVWDCAPLDILVNNAGVDVLTGSNAKLSFAEKLELLWNVDVHATIHLSRSFGRRMKEHGSGTIVNMGWDRAEHGMAGDSGEMFAATKGSVTAFTRSLAKSLAPQVRVNCVAPGWIRTKWGEQASTYWQQRAVQESLLGRWGTPADVAAAVRFLVSPGAEFINGQVLAVNGGWSAQAPSSASDEF